MTVIWAPQKLQARLRAAFPIATREYLSLAKARFPYRSVGSTLQLRSVGTSAHVVSNDPRVRFFEEGVGPHIVEPKEGTVLRLADGRFVSGPIRHPGMNAQPTLRPLLATFPLLYRRRAAALMRF